MTAIYHTTIHDPAILLLESAATHRYPRLTARSQHVKPINVVLPVSSKPTTRGVASSATKTKNIVLIFFPLSYSSSFYFRPIEETCDR